MVEILKFNEILHYPFFLIIGYVLISKVIKNKLKKYNLLDEKETKCIIYILEIITNPFILYKYAYVISLLYKPNMTINDINNINTTTEILFLTIFTMFCFELAYDKNINIGLLFHHIFSIIFTFICLLWIQKFPILEIGKFTVHFGIYLITELPVFFLMLDYRLKFGFTKFIKYLIVVYYALSRVGCGIFIFWLLSNIYNQNTMQTNSIFWTYFSIITILNICVLMCQAFVFYIYSCIINKNNNALPS